MADAWTRSSSDTPLTTAQVARLRLLLRRLRPRRLPRRPRLLLPSLLLRSVPVAASLLVASTALATTATTPAAAPVAATAAAAAPASRIVEVRIALSSDALKKLSEPRLRRLLEIEIEGSAVLAPGAVGPLGDHVAYIWVDRPAPTQIVIEVRVGDRAVVRREIAASGLSGDVAARLVAIAASEMVRDQMEPVRAAPRRPPPPRKPTDAEIALASRGQPGIQLLAAADVAFAPEDAAVLAGPSIGVGFRYYGVSETLFARWLTGPSRGGALRWLEFGLSADYRLWLSPSFRLAFGAEAALASAHLGDATVASGAPGERDTWSARAGGRLGAELHLGGPVWLGLTATPGAVLRPIRYETPSGKGTFEGLWVGAGLGLTFEWGRKAAPPPAPAP